MFNEAEQMTARTKTSQANEDDGDGKDDTSPREQIMCASLGSYEDVVVLRPKSEQQQQQHNNRRLARPLAVLSGLFKSHRESGSNQEENTHENSTKSLTMMPSCVIADNKTVQKKPKKKTWNIFKSKKKSRDVSPSFKHFQEPLNVERVSLPIGPYIDNDAEWYDLNREDMSLFEARVSDIVDEFNNGNQMFGDSESESMYRCDLGRYLTISTNILWSHNLSVSCQSNGNASNINLLGANINRDQIHSDIFIEDGDSLNENVYTFNKGLNSSVVSTDSVDSDGYAVMHPTSLSKKKYPIEQTVLIDDIMTTKSTTNHCYNNSDDSSNLSSGFGSDSDVDNSSPQKSLAFASVAAAAVSPATSDFTEAFPLPSTTTTTTTTPLTAKSMEKISKKCRLQIRSKLLGMLYAKQTISLSNVTPTPQSKESPECIKKCTKGRHLKCVYKKK